MGRTDISERFVKFIMSASIDSIIVEHGESIFVEKHDEIIDEFSVVEGEIVYHESLEYLFWRDGGESASHDEGSETLEETVTILILSKFFFEGFQYNWKQLNCTFQLKHVLNDAIKSLFYLFFN